MKGIAPTKEYTGSAPRIESSRFFVSPPKKKKEFVDAAFGIFRKTLGKKSPLAYINAMRKAWRK